MAGFDTTTVNNQQAFRDGARAAINALATLQRWPKVSPLRYEDFATPEDYVQAHYSNRRAAIARVVEGFGPKTDQERGHITALVELAMESLSNGHLVECAMSDVERADACASFAVDVGEDMKLVSMNKRNTNVINFPKRIS